MPYKISFVISIGGIALTIIACQLIILMKNIVEEMHYRETCARHYSGFSSSEKQTLEELGLSEQDSILEFCNHFK